MKSDRLHSPDKTAMVIGATVLANLDNHNSAVCNGVKEPGVNDPTRPMWDAFNELHELGAEPTVQTARKVAQRTGQNVNAAVVTFYLWQKFYNR